MLSICILLFKKKDMLGSYKYLMISAMVLTYIIDTTCFFIRKSPNISNEYILQIYIYGSLGLLFLLFFLMYQKIIKNQLLNNISKGVIVLFLLSYFYHIFTINLSDGFPNKLLFFNVFLLLFVIALFLIDVFNTDLILDIKNYFPFWFSLGLIILYMAMVPSVIITGISNLKMKKGLWSLVVFIINFLGYGITFLGLLKAKKLD